MPGIRFTNHKNVSIFLHFGKASVILFDVMSILQTGKKLQQWVGISSRPKNESSLLWILTSLYIRPLSTSVGTATLLFPASENGTYRGNLGMVEGNGTCGNSISTFFHILQYFNKSLHNTSNIPRKELKGCSCHFWLKFRREKLFGRCRGCC